MGDEVIGALVQFAATKPEFSRCGQQNQRLSAEDWLKRPVAAREIEREGFADPHDLVDPGFQGGGHAVIVHRRCDQNDVGLFNLLDKPVGGLKLRALLG